MDEELNDRVLEDPLPIGHLQCLVLALQTQFVAHHFLPELLAAIMCIIIFTCTVLLNFDDQVTPLPIVYSPAILAAFHGSLSPHSQRFEISGMMNLGGTSPLVVSCLIAHLILLFVLILNQNSISMYLICIVNLRHHDVVALAAPIINDLSGLLLLHLVFVGVVAKRLFNLNLVGRNAGSGPLHNDNNIN